MNTNLDPQTDDDEIMKATFDVEDAELAHSKTYFMSAWVQTIAYAAIQIFLLINYNMTSQVLGINPSSFIWVLVWLFVLYVVLYIIIGIVVTSIGHSLFYKYTGTIYVKNRMEYAYTGAYDLERLHAMIAQIAVFGIFWWTLQMDVDPIANIRSGWFFVLSCCVISIVLSVILYNILFSLYEGILG
jgi:hypothetical protein